jgi:hypothetical protein
VNASGEFQSRYAAAFERYVDKPGEEALSAAYDLGRSAVRSGMSLFDLATAHHDTLLAAIGNHPGADHAALVRAGGEFFVEAVSALEMAQRVLRGTRETAAVERRQAAVLRQLSSFLGDASIALDATSSLAEMLQLVAEHARELIGADRCVVRLAGAGDREEIVAEASTEAAAGEPAVEAAHALSAPLTALDGTELGAIHVYGKQRGAFTELDDAVLVQLAQMASAAVERAQLYRHRQG